MLTYSPARTELRRQGSLVLDPWAWTWAHADAPPADDAAAVTRADAVRQLHKTGNCRLVPVAVIGPRAPDDRERAMAYELGTAIGGLGVPLLCGGKTGVMEAAAQGAREQGALTIGIVPDNEWQKANRYIDLPLATGLGPARNVLVARMALALIAIGGQYGTITETAYGLHFGKTVIGLQGAPAIDGVQRLDSVEEAVEALLPVILRENDTS